MALAFSIGTFALFAAGLAALAQLRGAPPERARRVARTGTLAVCATGAAAAVVMARQQDRRLSAALLAAAIPLALAGWLARSVGAPANAA